MKKPASATVIGAFVLGATGLAVIAITVLWGGRLFTRSHQYVLYFNGDVNGLQVGAAVKFKGVEVGYVDRILLSMSDAKDNKPPSLMIPVIISLNSKTVVHQGTGYLDLDNPTVVRNLVKQGLRGQIGSESLVTGILYVSLDMHPETPAHFAAPTASRYPEIPTIPTAFEQAQEMITRALQQLSHVDLNRLITGLTQTASKLGDLAASPNLKRAIDELPGAIDQLSAAANSIQNLANNANTQMTATAEALRKTSSSATVALEQTQVTLKSVRDTIGPESPLNYQLGQTLEDLSQASRAMRELADYLDRNPSALVRGRANEATH
jgi:paraquat-inducible protein B